MKKLLLVLAAITAACSTSKHENSATLASAPTQGQQLGSLSGNSAEDVFGIVGDREEAIVSCTSDTGLTASCSFQRSAAQLGSLSGNSAEDVFGIVGDRKEAIVSCTSDTGLTASCSFRRSASAHASTNIDPTEQKARAAIAEKLKTEQSLAYDVKAIAAGLELKSVPSLLVHESKYSFSWTEPGIHVASLFCKGDANVIQSEFEPEARVEVTAECMGL